MTQPRHLPIFAALFSAIALIGLVGCGGDRTTDRDIAFVGVDSAAELVVGEARLLRDATRGAWVDPRLASDHLSERVPGALHVPLRDLRTRADELESYDVLVVYGLTFKDPIALAASKVLLELGIADVYTLEGGLRAWTDAGRPTASGRPTDEEIAGR
ncbi:MAG: rhodanese-like domain-containing protein [Phycisphaerales bacterium]